MGGWGMANARNFMRKEDERIKRAHERHRRRVARKVQRIAREGRFLDERVGNAEDYLGQSLLLAMAVNRLLQKKRILSKKRIAQVAKRVDLWDGCRDGMLDPAVLRPENEQVPQSQLSPEEFLRQLEDEE